jgi:hypothetical protein
MKNPMKSWRRIPMKKRPTETIHVLAETPVSPEGEAVAVPTVPTKYERLPLLAICVYIFLGLSLILYAIGLASPTFADFFNRYISSAVRATTATLTGWIPFSLAETLLLFLPVIVVSLVVYAVRFRCDSWRTVFVYVGEICAIVAFLFSLFIWSFGMAYQGTGLEDKLNLDRRDVSVEELEETAFILLEQVNALADEIDFRNSDFSVMPYSLSELNDKLLIAYHRVDDDLPFLQTLNSRLKPVINSELMSHAHITGVYTYFTGEANLNMVFPDYTLPYTAAHELAHQRGIAREDEANFIAFLVCIASDDPYIQYSGYLNMFEYVVSALNKADSARYQAAFAELDRRAYFEEIAYAEFYAKYRHSKVSNVSNAVNDTYLKLQGTPGAQSYGMVVDLAVAYYKKNP